MDRMDVLSNCTIRDQWIDTSNTRVSSARHAPESDGLTDEQETNNGLHDRTSGSGSAHVCGAGS